MIKQNLNDVIKYAKKYTKIDVRLEDYSVLQNAIEKGLYIAYGLYPKSNDVNERWHFYSNDWITAFIIRKDGTFVKRTKPLVIH